MAQEFSNFKFKKTMRFHGKLEKKIAEIINEHPGIWAAIPSGEYKGEGIKRGTALYRFDVDPQVRPDFVCDIWDIKEHWLIKTSDGFDGIVCDPIWFEQKACAKCGHIYKNKKGLGYDKRAQLSFILRDLLKPGGLLIMNNTWNAATKGLKLVIEWKIEKGMSNSAFLSVYRRQA